jgi:hypothetical protein
VVAKLNFGKWFLNYGLVLVALYDLARGHYVKAAAALAVALAFAGMRLWWEREVGPP